MDWTAMIGLGAYHGINPGMGWLFAVALGMQAGRASEMWRALPPIALGHAISVGVVVALFAGAGVVLPLHVVKVVIAARSSAWASIGCGAIAIRVLAACRSVFAI